MASGKILAPILPTMVTLLRRDGEIVVTDAQAVLLSRMSAATIDRRLAPTVPTDRCPTGAIVSRRWVRYSGAHAGETA